MIYSSFSLNGSWKMAYAEDAYLGTELPSFEGYPVEDAVPGYWEDMTDKFRLAPFFRELKINPEYGVQKYPIAHTVPDMALPNIVGNFYYERTFICEDFIGTSYLHFSGVQNAVSVWMNGKFLGRHEGYSTPFDIEIPDGLIKSGENTVVLSVSNHRLKGVFGEPVLGLTSRATCEYTGGITGDIELRVYNSPLRDIAFFTSRDLKTVTAKVDAVEKCDFEWKIKDGEKEIKSGKANGDFSFDTEGLTLWSPENPRLYTIELIDNDGVLTRSFGIRRLTPDGTHFRLNSNPYFLRGVCEHFYLPDTVHPHHDLVYYRKIVKEFKKLGFNFIRFHTYVPCDEYMQAADELGMLIQVESPNNTTFEEWKEIVAFCRRHPSVVIFCCGNELHIDEPFIEHLKMCAEEVHKNTDGLFSPMSALRGIEYWWGEPDPEPAILEKPFKHHTERLKSVGEFSDMYNSYAQGLFSYCSLEANVDEINGHSVLYNKPRVSHEICIDGTFADLSLKDRYISSRIGNTEMFTSVEKHLKDKGVLDKAPIYFKNSCQWQRRVRKYCFEMLRRCDEMAGYDFLGPIDTHWHTFGYDVGMMNEFYELKPGETVENILRYNSETVVLTDLERNVNFESGGSLKFGVFTSYYGTQKLWDATLTIKLFENGKVIFRENVTIDEIESGKVLHIYDFERALPEVTNPTALTLKISLDCGETFAQNEWELYLFPKAQNKKSDKLMICDKLSQEELIDALKAGKNIVLFGTEPFNSQETSFQITLPGRTFGNLATVIADHPVMKNLPHEGFCGWQFNHLLEKGMAVCLEDDTVPFDPIIEVVPTHKFFIHKSAMFELSAFSGKLFVCGFNFCENDPAAKWLKSEIIAYAESDEFNPKINLSEDELNSFINGKITRLSKNENIAFNPNDKTAKKKQ